MRTRPDERGSVLIIAVIAMLIMGVLSVSFALLSQVESKIGVNYRQQAQAEAVAEAGLYHALSLVQASALQTSITTATLLSNVSFGGGTYSARIDNDCAAYNVVPAAIQDTGCPTPTDSNEAAVLTAWGTVGSGRARVRALVTQDNVWKHVCSDSQNNPSGLLCNQAGNQSGNATLVPADPGDPHAIRDFPALPLPIIGCSQIDPTLHGMNLNTCLSIAAGTQLFAQPAVSGYPQFPAIPNSGGPQLVLMGEDPGITTGSATSNNDPAPGGPTYFGYFDSALSTYCDPLVLGNVCPGGTPRLGCLKPGDSRLTSDPTHYVAPTVVAGSITVGCRAAGLARVPPVISTGMVYTGSQTFTGNIGSVSKPLTVYVVHDPTASMNPNGSGAPTVSTSGASTQLIGTLVVEGAVNSTTATQICTGGPLPPPPTTGVCPVSPITGSAYGYPLAVVGYDPKLPYPTVTPQSAQPVGITFSNENINGMIYSGGTVNLTPNSSQNGTIVAFATNLQAGNAQAYYRYIATYSNAAPPPGFRLTGAGTTGVVLKSFIACSNFTSNVSPSPPSDASGSSVCQ